MTSPKFRSVGNRLRLVDSQPRTLADTTFEERRKMSVAELILLMGDGWVGHAQYKPRGKVRITAQVLNLATHRPPEIDVPQTVTFLGLVRMTIRWVMR